MAIRIGDVWSLSNPESETITPDDRQQTIEILGGVSVQDFGHIEAGERCRLIRDDFWPLMTWFEHIRCPSAPAPVVCTAPRPPKRPAAIPIPIPVFAH